jgi:site-specific DNA-methyltransferase (adenine-specific)
MACAIEDAGFVVYDCITWLYGQGFPKSKKLPDGFGTALKPSCELIVLARKPLSENTIGANFEKWGTGGLNIEGCRVPCTETAADRVEEASMNKRYADKGSTSFSALPGKRRGRPLRVIDPKLEANGSVYAGRQKPGSGFDGGSKAMGTTDLGRWPANVITDGSEEVFSAFPNAPGQLFATGSKYRPKQGTAVYGDYGERPDRDPIGDSGSAARFFYSAKADADDRLGFTHPTIKPLDLIRYLVRLITPPGGTCLDPFAGTGTLGEAAYQEGMKAILIEREAEYQAMIRERIRIMQEGGYARDVAKMRPPKDPGLLFGE